MESRPRRPVATIVFAALFIVWLLRCLKTFVIAVLRDDHDATVPEPPAGMRGRRARGPSSRE